jgi:hypothetical protein
MDMDMDMDMDNMDNMDMDMDIDSCIWTDYGMDRGLISSRGRR